MNKVYHITEREFVVLNLLIQGYSNPQIAEKLNITVHTVKAHISSIYEKTGVNSRVNLTVLACSYGVNNNLTA